MINNLQPLRLDLTYVPQANDFLGEKHRRDANLAVTDLRDGHCRGSEFTGWLDYPEKFGWKECEKIETDLAKVREKHNAVLVIGIGGSYLGTRAAYHYLHDQAKRPIFFIGQDLSFRTVQQVLRELDSYDPIVNVISKSGTTTEPAIALRIVRKYLESRFGEAGANQRIIATTDASKGALVKMVNSFQWPRYVVPDDVGGRFSVLTAVGLVPLFLAGLDIKAMLAGAELEFQTFRSQGVASPAVAYAMLRQGFYLAGKKVELLCYSDPFLNYLAEWWKQLFGESEGKERQGMFPASAMYTTDLHSLGQYVQEGQEILLETFLEVNAGHRENVVKIPQFSRNDDELAYLESKTLQMVNQVAMTATKEAHLAGGVSCIGIEAGNGITMATVGQLFAFHMLACAVSAGLLKVNAFDQPGVEAYKKNMFRLLGKPKS